MIACVAEREHRWWRHDGLEAVGVFCWQDWGYGRRGRGVGVQGGADCARPRHRETMAGLMLHLRAPCPMRHCAPRPALLPVLPQSDTLEWIIIVLIAVEIMLTLLDFYHRGQL